MLCKKFYMYIVYSLVVCNNLIKNNILLYYVLIKCEFQVARRHDLGGEVGVHRAKPPVGADHSFEYRHDSIWPSGGRMLLDQGGGECPTGMVTSFKKNSEGSASLCLGHSSRGSVPNLPRSVPAVLRQGSSFTIMLSA